MSTRNPLLIHGRTSQIIRWYHTALLPAGAKAFINGEWRQALSGSTFQVRNPYNNKLLMEVENCDVGDAEESVKAAKEAFLTWSLYTTARERSELLQRWHDIMMQKEAQLAEILTLEEGKPLEEARGEIKYAASFLQWFGEEARRINGQIVSPPSIHRTHFHTREPIGVVGIITPWNFPAAMITRKAAAALACGCTTVVKPAEDTPLTALALAQTAREAGIPDGVFNVIPADREKTAAISKYICETPDVNAISFTGSTEVGKLLLAQSANSVKRVCLELGGNAPLIVFPSAHLASAVEGTMASKFRGSGQTCICANRIFVHSWIYDSFVDGIKQSISKLVVGDGTEPEVTQGPMINEKAIKKVEELVDDALQLGARVVCGGRRGKEGTTYLPTLLTDVTQKMKIANTEIFGPVLAVQKFETEDEVMALANQSRKGLAGYIFTQNYSQMMRVSRQLQVGVIGINEGLISCAEGAFGGVKESGLGREGGNQGIDEFTNWKYICIAC